LAGTPSHGRCPKKTQILNLLSFPPRLVGVYYREAYKIPG